MANGPVFPRVHAMVFCDGITRVDPEGRVVNLSGVRTEIRASRFPYSHPRLCIYVQATGHEGTAPCRFVLVEAASDEDVFSTSERTVHFYGPLRVVHIVRRIRNWSFPRPGLYYIQAHFGGKLANERLLLLTQDTVTGNGEGT